MRVLKRLVDAVMHADETTYADMQTMFGHTRVYDATNVDGNTIRVLDVNGSWQSGSYVDDRWSELAFVYHRRFDEALFGCGAPMHNMLMLGGGALSFPKHVLTHHDDVRVEVVEADPAMTDLARRYFFVRRLSGEQAARLRIVHDDAAERLAASARKQAGYDAIVNDAFAAFEAPPALAGATAATRAHAALAPGGIYLSNVVSAIAGADARGLIGVTQALARSFAHVWVVPLGVDEPLTPDNNVVIATDAAYSFAGALSPEELFC